jgi:nitrogen fixation/metabolism regulation signal transduction histidine kinase
VSLRARLTLWFLVLALVPSLLLSVLVLQQLVSTVEWWDSAGADEALTSSVVVAKNTLKHLESNLRQSSGVLFEKSRQAHLELGPGQPDRMFIERYLESAGLDLYQVYMRAPRDSTWRLAVDLPPSGVTRATSLNLAAEIDAGSVLPDQPVQSTTGVFGLVDSLPPDSASGARRLVAVGYALPPDFFLRLSEVQLGLGTFRALYGYAEVFKWYFRLAVLVLLLLVAVVAVFAARTLARNLARPIANMARTLATVDGGEEVRLTPTGAPEVRQLAEAFNAMTARLALARAELARAERVAAWQGVAKQVAHEIKNPLTTMGLALYNMERDLEQLPEDARARVSRAVHSLSREIESMTDLAESFATLGELPPIAPAVVDVNALVESLVAVSQWPHVAIETRLDPARPLALADERQLRRVLRNLLKNACEAQPGGGRVLMRTAGAQTPGAGDSPRAVEVAVEDEGPGMTRDVLERAFEPGFTTKGTSGKGVGLAVSRRVIEAHGGRIEVDSAPGHGTRVTVRLPEADTEGMT